MSFSIRFSLQNDTIFWAALIMFINWWYRYYTNLLDYVLSIAYLTEPLHNTTSQQTAITHQDLHAVMQAARWIRTELFDIAIFFLLNIYSAYSCIQHPLP